MYIFVLLWSTEIKFWTWLVGEFSFCRGHLWLLIWRIWNVSLNCYNYTLLAPLLFLPIVNVHMISLARSKHRVKNKTKCFFFSFMWQLKKSLFLKSGKYGYYLLPHKWCFGCNIKYAKTTVISIITVLFKRKMLINNSIFKIL